jgi:hypothetical protein
MVLAYHCILGFYGFWLPNDPRGSGSDYIASWELFRYGPATKSHSRRSVAHKPHDHELRLSAKDALKHPPIEISGRQALAIAQGFWTASQEAGYRFHACAILPDHLHLVIGWHWRDIRLLVGHLRAQATRAVRKLALPPFHDDNAVPVWGAHGWNVALDSPQAVDRAIAYADDNPEKEGLPRQRWQMVVPFDPLDAIAAHAAAKRDGISLYQKRRLGGAAKASQEARQERERRQKDP